jgi:hypothetical protein
MEQKGYFEATYFTLRTLLATGVIFFLIFIFGGLIAAFTCMLGFCFMLFANYDRSKFTLPFIFILISPLFMLYGGWRSVKKSKLGLGGAAINGLCIALVPSFIANIPAWIFALLMPLPGILVAAEATAAGVIALFSGLILGALGGLMAMQKNKWIALVLALLIFMTTSTILFNVGTSIRPELVADLTGGPHVEMYELKDYVDVLVIEKTTEIPIYNAKVEVYENDKLVKTLYTDLKGDADFGEITTYLRKEIGVSGGENKIFLEPVIKVSKEGYQTLNVTDNYFIEGTQENNFVGHYIYVAYLVALNKTVST